MTGNWDNLKDIHCLDNQYSYRKNGYYFASYTLVCFLDLCTSKVFVIHMQSTNLEPTLFFFFPGLKFVHHCRVALPKSSLSSATVTRDVFLRFWPLRLSQHSATFSSRGGLSCHRVFWQADPIFLNTFMTLFFALKSTNSSSWGIRDHLYRFCSFALPEEAQPVENT